VNNVDNTVENTVEKNMLVYVSDDIHCSNKTRYHTTPIRKM